MTGQCQAPDCSQPTGRKRAAYCEMHYQRLHRHGSLERPVKVMPKRDGHYKWTGGEGTYTAVHRRLRAVYGPAREHTCTCGAPAAHWSYDGQAPDEQQSADGPYSTTLTHYQPRCVPCHKRRDMEIAKDRA